MIRILVRLYPRPWRERYAEEFTALLEDEGVGPQVVVDVVFHALRSRLELRRSLVRSLVAAAIAAGVEWYAVTTGYTDNLLWVPHGARSAVLLVGAAAAMLVAVAPIVLTMAKRAARIRRAA
jgi:hypothetical protein